MAAESSETEPLDDLVENLSNPEMVPEVLQDLHKSRKHGKSKSSCISLSQEVPNNDEGGSRKRCLSWWRVAARCALQGW